MNSKLLYNEDNRIKIDNMKNITLSDLISKKKKFKNLCAPKDIQIFNQKPKKTNNILNNKIDKNSNLKQYGNNASIRMTTNHLSKNEKIAKLSIELFQDKPLKIKGDLIKNKNRMKRNLSSRKIYPKKYLKEISELTDNNYLNRKKKRTKTFNKNKKDQMKCCKKLIERIHASNYDGGIPLMDFEKSKRKKKFLSNTLKEKSINQNITKNNKNYNLSFNQRNNYNMNKNVISKPQCLYKVPLKYDASSIGDDDIIQQNNNQSLFKTFMSRNLKPNKNEYKEKENNKDSQACTFIKYDVNGTTRTKRIFNSTFHIDNDETDFNRNKFNKDIVATVNEKDKGNNKNKKKRTFGGIMFSGLTKLF